MTQSKPAETARPVIARGPITTPARLLVADVEPVAGAPAAGIGCSFPQPIQGLAIDLPFATGTHGTGKRFN